MKREIRQRNVQKVWCTCKVVVLFFLCSPQLRHYLHCARLQTRKSFNNQVVIIWAGISHTAAQRTEVWFVDHVIFHKIKTGLFVSTWRRPVPSDHHRFTSGNASCARIRRCQGSPGAEHRGTRGSLHEVILMQHKRATTESFTDLALRNKDGQFSIPTRRTKFFLSKVLCIVLSRFDWSAELEHSVFRRSSYHLRGSSPLDGKWRRIRWIRRWSVKLTDTTRWNLR